MKEENNYSEGINIIHFLFRWRRLLAGVVTIAGILSILLTTLLPKKYEATARFFPPAFNKEENLSLNASMGFNLEADRLINIAQSATIKDSLIEKFDLIKFYNVDTNNAVWRENLYSRINNNLSLERTKYMSVVISFRSSDPEVSAAVVNEIMSLLSRFLERMVKVNMTEPLTYAESVYYEKSEVVAVLLQKIHTLRGGNRIKSIDLSFRQMSEKQNELKNSAAELSKLRENGSFFEYGEQLDNLQLELVSVRQKIALTSAKLKSAGDSELKNDTLLASLKGQLAGQKESEEILLKRLDAIQQWGKDYQRLSGQFEADLKQYNSIKYEYESLLNSFEPNIRSLELESLESEYNVEKQLLNELKSKYEKALIFYNQPFTDLFVVEYAKANYKKASPSFGKNLLVSMFSSFFLTVIILLFKQKWLEFKTGQQAR